MATLNGMSNGLSSLKEKDSFLRLPTSIWKNLSDSDTVDSSKCRIFPCEKDSRIRGYCSKHYVEVLSTKSPLGGLSNA